MSGSEEMKWLGKYALMEQASQDRKGPSKVSVCANVKQLARGVHWQIVEVR